MSNPHHVKLYGNQLIVVHNDGTQSTAFQTGGVLWLLNKNGLKHIRQYGDQLVVTKTDGSQVTAYSTSTNVWMMKYVADYVPPVELFQWPFDPNDTSDEYGWRTDPVGFHNGLDFTPGAGSPVPVSGAGVVSTSQFNSALGNYIVVAHGTHHGDEVWTGYAHMQNRNFAVGDVVNKGDILGNVGNTGSASDGAHLHWVTLTTDSSMWNPNANYMHVNPRDWMSKYQYE